MLSSTRLPKRLKCLSRKCSSVAPKPLTKKRTVSDGKVFFSCAFFFRSRLRLRLRLRSRASSQHRCRTCEQIVRTLYRSGKASKTLDQAARRRPRPPATVPGTPAPRICPSCSSEATRETAQRNSSRVPCLAAATAACSSGPQKTARSAGKSNHLPSSVCGTRPRQDGDCTPRMTALPRSRGGQFPSHAKPSTATRSLIATAKRDCGAQADISSVTCWPIAWASVAKAAAAGSSAPTSTLPSSVPCCTCCRSSESSCSSCPAITAHLRSRQPL
mmetsp:Transcript_29592/g.81361  ORF Transcript_29592/g.81361 Transcript_29592/m.81361 type:complete len:273 (+) Transcript_29592:1673-2491(+)